MQDNLQIPGQEALPETDAVGEFSETGEFVETGTEEAAAMPSQPAGEIDDAVTQAALEDTVELMEQLPLDDDANPPENGMPKPDLGFEEDADAELPSIENPTETGALVRVKFNKRERVYTTDEAAPLVEMGLKWDRFRAHHEKLRYLALAQGQSVGEMIDRLMDDNDGELYRQLLDECGGNEAAAGRLLEVQKAERQRHFEQAGVREQEEAHRVAEEEQVQLEQRLAEEFLQLTDEMPERFGAFTDVPAAVVESAVRDNVPLLDAYLRHEFREARVAAATRARQVEAAMRSTGSLGGAQSTPEPDLDSFERAFQTALR